MLHIKINIIFISSNDLSLSILILYIYIEYQNICIRKISIKITSFIIYKKRRNIESAKIFDF